GVEGGDAVIADLADTPELAAFPVEQDLGPGAGVGKEGDAAALIDGRRPEYPQDSAAGGGPAVDGDGLGSGAFGEQEQPIAAVIMDIHHDLAPGVDRQRAALEPLDVPARHTRAVPVLSQAGEAAV